MKRSYDSPARAAMKRLCTLLGLMLAVMLSITLYTRNLLIQGNYAQIRDIPLSSLQAPQIDWKESLSNLQNREIGSFGSGMVNILLVGQDHREGEDTARSDSIILCTFNKETGKLILTSFLRDLYVPIPGHSSNRINAAYANGGIELLEETLETNFGLHIDGGIEVDFSQFSGIIDLLGGVEVTLRQDEADFINEATGSTLSEGLYLLDGTQALVYSRIRSLDSDGDFSRTDRQRKVLSALLDRCKNAGLTELLGLLDELMPMTSTDMSKLQVLTLAMEFLPDLSGMQVVSQHVPVSGTYTDETIDGMAVLVPDTAAVQDYLSNSLSG